MLRELIISRMLEGFQTFLMCDAKNVFRTNLRKLRQKDGQFSANFRTSSHKTYMILECPLHHAPRRYHGLLVQDDETLMLAQQHHRQHLKRNSNKKKTKTSATVIALNTVIMRCRFTHALCLSFSTFCCSRPLF